MEADKAKNKSTGFITMKIEKFSEFTQQKGKDGRRLSDPIYVQNLTWKILAMPREKDDGNGKPIKRSLGFFLQCNAEDQESNWACYASAKLKLLAQKEGNKDYVREIEHIFHAKEDDWGYAGFMTFEALMDPGKGWYDKSIDSITLRAEFEADIPVGIVCGMCEDLGNLFDKRDKYFDCTVVSSDGVKFKVYKGILASRSPVFAAMFEHKMVEAQNGIVQIEDIKSEVLEQLLRFMYSGKQPNMEENIAEELLAAANKYELAKLKLFCERKLATFLDDENACALLVKADQNLAKLIKAESIKYIQENAKKVRQTEGWKMLLNGNYGELVDQIVDAFLRKELEK